MSKNPLLHTLIAMTGQGNVITVHRPLVEFTGSLEAGMMLSQLLYWTPKSSMGGWVAKSDKDWNDELCLTRYSIRTATTTLKDMGVIETKLKKFSGAPTTHYLVKWEQLEKLWTEWLDTKNGLSESRQSDYAKSDNALSEKEQSLTETTAKTNTEINLSIIKGIFSENSPSFDFVSVIEYYLKRFQEERGHEHPVYNKKKWEKVIAKLPIVDNGLRTTELSELDLETMIDKHFRCRYQNCDYHMLHFVSGLVMENRAYETAVY